MVRFVLGVIGGFAGWILAWFGGERILSAMSPEGFGVPQAAFQAAVENGGEFTAPTSLLLTHLVLGSVVSLLSGFLAAVISGENNRSSRVLGYLLVAFGLLKAVMSWQYVPIWYSVIFTALLFPMTIMGGKLRTNS